RGAQRLEVHGGRLGASAGDRRPQGQADRRQGGRAVGGDRRGAARVDGGDDVRPGRAMTTLTRAQVRELDRRAIEEYGVPGVVLMENAGRGAAEVLMRLNPERRPVMIFCGKGNNGGDGFVIARHLDNHRWPVVVVLTEAPPETGDAEVNYHPLVVSGVRRVHSFRAAEESDAQAFWKDYYALRNPLGGRVPQVQPAWIVDALFGTGLSGPLREPYPSIVGFINRTRDAGDRVLAVDIPSGLDCDTGK